MRGAPPIAGVVYSSPRLGVARTRRSRGAGHLESKDLLQEYVKCRMLSLEYNYFRGSESTKKRKRLPMAEPETETKIKTEAVVFHCVKETQG